MELACFIAAGWSARSAWGEQGLLTRMQHARNYVVQASCPTELVVQQLTHLSRELLQPPLYVYPLFCGGKKVRSSLHVLILSAIFWKNMPLINRRQPAELQREEGKYFANKSIRYGRQCSWDFKFLCDMVFKIRQLAACFVSFLQPKTSNQFA